MRGWVVKTPTVAVLCQTSRGVVREGLGNSCSPRESRLRMGAGRLEHLAGPHAEPGPLRRQTEARQACIKSFLFHFLSDLIFQRLGPVHLHCGEASRVSWFSLPGLCGWLEDPAKSASPPPSSLLKWLASPLPPALQYHRASAPSSFLVGQIPSSSLQTLIPPFSKVLTFKFRD